MYLNSFGLICRGGSLPVPGRTCGQQGEDIHQSNQTTAWGHLEDSHANSQKAHSMSKMKFTIN